MDQKTYLDRYQALTAPALDELALMLGRMDGDEAATAATYLSDLRSAQDALWEEFKDTAIQGMNP